jgi:xylulokinase
VSEQRLWLGVDVGTQGVRALVVGSDGRVMSHGTVAFPRRPQPADGMIHDPKADWADGAVAAARDAVGGVQARRIAGVAVCGLFPACALLDADGQPIGDGLLYGDRRAAGFVPLVAGQLDVRLTGDEVSPRLAWLRSTQPAELERARWVVGPAGFVIHLLTDRVTIDPQSAYRWGGLTDAMRTGWSPRALDVLGIPRRLMPDIVVPTAPVGTVTLSAAALTGLPAGTPVMGGVTDSLATLIGHGVVRAGQGLIYYGSTWTAMLATCDLETALKEPSLIGDEAPWRLAAYVVDAGRFVERLRTAMFNGQAYEKLDAAAATVPPGAHGLAVIPVPTARFENGQSLPSRAAIVGIGLEYSQADVWRATLESMGFLIADGLEPDGRQSRWMAAAGTGARSEIWRQIISDITNLEQRYDPRGSAAFGAAFLAAYGLGGVNSLDPVAEGWLTGKEAAWTWPEPRQVMAYRRHRPTWRRLASVVTQIGDVGVADPQYLP